MMKKLLATVVVALAIAPIAGLIEAFTYSTLWRWFVARQYGHGPSYPVWYGLAMILGLIVHNTRRQGAEKGAKAIITTTIAVWIVYMLILGLAYLTGSIFGWL